ncbi:MAG: hypothetical protein RLZZ238_2345 [Planctomycetota bacterium]
MTATEQAPKRPSPARILLQVTGFVVGCVLIAWCIQRAFAHGSGGLEKLRAADPSLVALLLGSTLVSIICSGFTFLTMARPLRRFSAVEMQAVNLMASLFNYAPVRLGFALRCVFHWRVEKMRVPDLVSWIAGVAIVTLGALGSGLAAGLLQVAIGRERLELDWMWFATYLACLVIGSGITILVGRNALLRRFLKGGERVLSSPRALAESLAFRTVDLAMWGLRMWSAAQIVGVTLGPAQAMLLASLAMLGAGNPLGRIGWREALVAIAAPYILTGTSGSDELDALTSQMALLESAGEAAITIPLGLLGAVWCLRAVRRVPSSSAVPQP